MRGGTAGAVGVVLAALSVAAPASAELPAAKPLGYTGAQQTYAVSAGVTSSTAVASGAPIDTSTVGKHTFTVFNDWASGPSRVATTITYTVSGASGGGLTKGSSSVSGATTKHPKLTVKVSAPHGESISKVSIVPPAGFAFVRSALKHGVNASGATGVLLSHGALVIKLKHSVSSVKIKVSDGAFRLSGKVVKKIKKGKLKSVIFTVDASLSTGSIAQLSLTTRL